MRRQALGARRNSSGIDVEWDEHKNQSNQRKHGISFEDAATVFNDPLSLAVPDQARSLREARFHIIGTSAFGALLVLTYTERAGKIRLINARTPTPRERKEYEEGD